MLKVYCDFNDVEGGERCFNLWYGKATLEEQKDALKLADGQRVLLFQDEDDFEVEATIRLGQSGSIVGRTVCAEVDWATLKRF